jgi:hypothetical protein
LVTENEDPAALEAATNFAGTHIVGESTRVTVQNRFTPSGPKGSRLDRKPGEIGGSTLTVLLME